MNLLWRRCIALAIGFLIGCDVLQCATHDGQKMVWAFSHTRVAVPPRARRRRKATLFVIYSREDYQRIQPLLKALKAVGVDVWIDMEELKPGQNWQTEIVGAIGHAVGALFFISPRSVHSHYAQMELMVFHERAKLIFPIVVERTPQLSAEVKAVFAPRQQYDLTTPTIKTLSETATQIAEALQQFMSLGQESQRISEEVPAREAAALLASETRKEPSDSSLAQGPPSSVFIVHGHDDKFLSEVESYLLSLGIKSIVLRKIGGPAQSLFQKFLQWGTDTRFALVLLSADDLGASRSQYEAEGVGDRALKFRTRQNVILELGFFYGHLGWENVFVLLKSPDRVFPDFERPSDLEGVLFDRVEESGQWKDCLRDNLIKAGFVIQSHEKAQ